LDEAKADLWTPTTDLDFRGLESAIGVGWVGDDKTVTAFPPRPFGLWNIVRVADNRLGFCSITTDFVVANS